MGDVTVIVAGEAERWPAHYVRAPGVGRHRCQRPPRAHGLPLRLLAAVKGPLPGVPLSLSPLPPACNALQVAVVGLSVVAPDILSPCN